MQMKIIVETEEEYNAWIASQQTFGKSMASAQ
jgi:cytochrome c oxidase subunit 2